MQLSRMQVTEDFTCLVSMV